MRLNIGELLLKASMISPRQLQDALNYQKLSGGKLSKAFVSLGLVKDQEITSFLSVHFDIPSIDLNLFEVARAMISIIPAATARKYHLLPLSLTNGTLTIATADPADASAIDDVRSMTGYNVEPVVASESALEEAIDRYYGAVTAAGELLEIDLSELGLDQTEPPRNPARSRPTAADGRGAPTSALSKDDKAAAWVTSERTAWAYVTAMHAAAVGRPRTPIRGIVEDVEDMRKHLTRERDVAQARVAKLERQLERRKSWSRSWRTSSLYAGIDRLQIRLTDVRRLLARAFNHPAGAPPASGSISGDDQDFIAEHLAEGRVYRQYGFIDKARTQFETVLERFPDDTEALGELDDLRGEGRDDEAALQRLVTMAKAPSETKAPTKARITLGELLMNENMVSLEQCLDALRDQKLNGGSLSAAIVRLGFLKDEEILSLLSRTYGLRSIRLEHYQPHPSLIDVIPPETARKHQVLPLAASTRLTIAVADPSDRLTIDAIASMTGCNVEPVVASESALADAIDRYYGPTRSPGGDVQHSAAAVGLRLAWSRQDEPRRSPGADPGGDPPVAS